MKRPGETVSEADVSVFDMLVEVKEIDRRLKKVMERAINKPGIHIALIGPLGTGKSLIASCIEKLPRSTFVSGTNVTRASLRDALLDKRPRFLVFDEEVEKKKRGGEKIASRTSPPFMKESFSSISLSCSPGFG